MSEADADDLAYRLAIRDREKDERRCCIECANWQRGSYSTGPMCAATEQRKRQAMDAKAAGEKPAKTHALSSIHPMPTLMQRCASFSWQKA